MNPPDQTPPTQPNIHNPLSVMQPGEQTICEIKRHPIGMFGVYAISGTLLLALAVLAFVIAPNVFADNRNQIMVLSSIIFILIGIVLLGFVFIANKVYWGNSWVVTSDSLTQITQTSLFSKQSSQLSLSNLEDITSEQRGVLQQLLKYGTLRAETAGERSKFMFPYCPNPNYYAQKILAAREAFEQARRAEQNAGGQLYPQQEAYQLPAQPVPPVQPPLEPPVPPAPPQTF